MFVLTEFCLCSLFLFRIKCQCRVFFSASDIVPATLFILVRSFKDNSVLVLPSLHGTHWHGSVKALLLDEAGDFSKEKAWILIGSFLYIMLCQTDTRQDVMKAHVDP